MNIEISTLQTFLKSIGFNWHDQYYNSNRRYITRAIDFKDLKSYKQPTTLKLQITDKLAYIDVFVTEKDFIIYEEIIDEKNQTRKSIPAKDLSKEWQAHIQNQTSNEQRI